MQDNAHIEAHKHHRFRDEILASEICGCFYCLKIFPPNQILQWVGREKDKALCPNCRIDSVIGSASGYPITKEFLTKMYEQWFENGISGEELSKYESIEELLKTRKQDL